MIVACGEELFSSQAEPHVDEFGKDFLSKMFRWGAISEATAVWNSVNVECSASVVEVCFILQTISGVV